MMSARSGLSPGTAGAVLERHLAQPVEQVPHFGAADLVAAHRHPVLPLGGHHHRGQAGERAARAEQQVRHEDRVLGVLAQVAVDAVDQFAEILRARPCPDTPRSAAPRRAAW